MRASTVVFFTAFTAFIACAYGQTARVDVFTDAACTTGVGSITATYGECLTNTGYLGAIQVTCSGSNPSITTYSSGSCSTTVVNTYTSSKFNSRLLFFRARKY